jgi:cellulose synthase (UDP-forming)
MDSVPLDGSTAWGPTLLTLGAFLCIAWLSPADETRRGARLVRIAAATLSAALVLRYATWRVQALPDRQSLLAETWVIVFVTIEMLNALSGLLVLLFLSRTIDRSAEADAAQDSPLLSAPTDVFIATYNEPRSVLERTIVGAMDIDHPDLRVWVLDDGAREWVRELAEELGALYLFRIKGAHAKAGNVNNALAHALRTGRRPRFVLLLDADFVANRQILRRTLGLFETADVGIVQTPQHFFNHDPVQVNLSCSHVWPDEQRFFFNVLLASKDAWGAAFLCGTSAVLRVEALEAAGGLATETVTEDTLTTYKMLEQGWRTILLNERLSLGLAPEGLTEYVTQRGRWCLGAIQQLHTRWSCFGRARLNLINRVSVLDVALYWIVSFPFKLMMLAAPAVYMWTGVSVIAATPADVVYWLLPSVAGSILFLSIYGRNLIVPVMTDVTQLLSAVVAITNVSIGLFRPHGRAFKVTAKGVMRGGITVQWGLMWPFLAIAGATISGLALNATSDSSQVGGAGFAVNVFWCLYSIVLIGLFCLCCIEFPRQRTDERFSADERGVVLWPGGAGVECRVRDISLGGARLTAGAWRAAHRQGVLLLDDGRVRVPFEPLRARGGELAIRFDDSPAVRRMLIGRLFGGDYGREVEHIAVRRVLGTLVSRLIG